jgi:hypothetical protein
MKATRNLSKKQRSIAASILKRAKEKGVQFALDREAAGTNGSGRIDRSFGCAVDAGTMGLKRVRGDEQNMKTFARRYKTSQSFAMGVSDGFEGFKHEGLSLAAIWDGYGYWNRVPTGTRRDYQSGVTVGRAVRAAAAV